MIDYRFGHLFLFLITSTNGPVLSLTLIRSSSTTNKQQHEQSFFKLFSTVNYLDSLSILEEAPQHEYIAAGQSVLGDNGIRLEEHKDEHEEERQISPSTYTKDVLSSRLSAGGDGISGGISTSSGITIEPMTWDGRQISENAYRINLPLNLLKELRLYADRMGITDMYRALLVEGRPLPPGGERAVGFARDDVEKEGEGGSSYYYNWMIQRPKSHWKSNMHWTSPADEEAHDDYLRVLSAGGFDQVLQEVGTYFELDAMSAYHLSFIGVSHCEKGFIHADVNDSGRKAFNMIIPLLLQEEDAEDGSGSGSKSGSHPTGELEILSDDETTTQFYKYEYNVASMVGDHALHATAACDYRQIDNGMRLAATVYIGDVTTENVNHLLMSLTQVYPPVGDAQHLLNRAGSHWSKTNPSKKLPSHTDIM